MFFSGDPSSGLGGYRIERLRNSLLALALLIWGTVPAHEAHGGGFSAGPAPGNQGFLFGSDCSLELDGPCPEGMVQVESFCIDRWEAHLEGWSPYEIPEAGVAASGPNVVPQGYISGDVAEAACRAAGKRLCTSAEWLRACHGPAGTTFPYGNNYEEDACNEGREAHPVIELFGDDAAFSSEEMNDPRLNRLPNSLDSTGANPECVTAEGIYDMHGNLHEWVADAEGTFRGGYYVDAVINGEGCLYVTTAHSPSYHDYSTGFRCCVDLP